MSWDHKYHANAVIYFYNTLPLRIIDLGSSVSAFAFDIFPFIIFHIFSEHFIHDLTVLKTRYIEYRQVCRQNTDMYTK